VYGEITDAGGLAVSSAPIPFFQLNGIPLPGSSAAGPKVAITDCTAGQQTKCTFLVSGVSLRDSAPLANVSGNLTINVTVDDQAKGGDGSPQSHRTTTAALNVPVTRIKWSTAIGSLTTVGGLAI